MFKNLLDGATSKMMTTSAVASLLVSGIVASTAFAVTSTYNSHQRDKHNAVYSLQAESAGSSHVTIGSGFVWPASQESTSVDTAESNQGDLPVENSSASELGSQPSTNNEQSKNDSGSTSDSQVENSASNSPGDSSDQSSSGATDSQDNQFSQNTEDTSSSQSQSSNYNYLLNVSGYCDGGWKCAQAAVNSYSLSYIYYAPNFQMIAGHNYGEAESSPTLPPVTSSRLLAMALGYTGLLTLSGWSTRLMFSRSEVSSRSRPVLDPRCFTHMLSRLADQQVMHLTEQRA